MPIQYKSRLSSTVVNNTFLDKGIDQLKKGKLGLYKVTETEPDAIDDVQQFMNDIADTTGLIENDPNRKVYATNNYVTDGDSQKTAIENFDTQMKLNTDEILSINNSVGAPSGICPLDSNTKVDDVYLPLDDKTIKGDSALTFDYSGASGLGGAYYLYDYQVGTWFSQIGMIISVPRGATNMDGTFTVGYKLTTTTGGTAKVKIYPVKQDENGVEYLDDSITPQVVGTLDASTIPVSASISTFDITISGSDFSNVGGVDLRGKRAVIAISGDDASPEDMPYTDELFIQLDYSATGYENQLGTSYGDYDWTTGLIDANEINHYDRVPQFTFSIQTEDDGELIVKDGGITETKLHEEIINTRLLKDDAVQGSKIKDGAITSIKIANDAVTTLKIADNNVNQSKIRLGAGSYLRSRNVANTADINLIRSNLSDDIVFGQLPKDTTVPTDDAHLVNKLYVDNATPTYEQEEPTGTVNGSNVTFILSSTPSENKSVQLYQAGLMQRQGVDYTISGTTITMTTAPNFGQDLWAYYTKG